MKKVLFSICLIVSLTITSFGQINSSSIQEEFDLPATVSETSGLIYFNDKMITHNDSGGANELYEIDLTTETITRTVTITNATNVDWEDIAQDDTSIYIADIGNNYGNRTNLVIYKISKADYLVSTSVMAEIIEISYSDQSDFTPNLNNNEWDAESLTSYNSTDLLLFNKNWVDGVTKAYIVPKTPGTYAVSPMTTTLNSGIRITGGTYNAISGKLYLIGYNGILQPSVWVSENFSSDDIFSGTNTQTPLSSVGFEQTEGIAFLDEDEYYVSSESVSSPISINAKLISFSTSDVALSVDDYSLNNELVIYPNPTQDYINVASEHINSLSLFDTKSTLLLDTTESKLDISILKKGVYFLKIDFKDKPSKIKKIIKI